MARAIGYSLNVFPSDTLGEVRATLAGPAKRLGEKAAPGGILPVELRLGSPAIDAIRREGRESEIADLLAAASLRCVSLNGFPLSPFHARRVKEDVFRPSWLEEERVRLTLELAEIGAAIAEPGSEITLSTLSGSFKLWGDGEDVRRDVAANLARTADGLDAISGRTGRAVTLCVEAEPFTTFETLPEMLDLFSRTGPHPRLAVNLDCAHQAVEFEEPAAWIAALAREGLRLGKLHVTHALAIRGPSGNPAGVATLRRLREERWLHQVVCGSGAVVTRRASDIPDLDLPGAAARAFGAADEARVHFHLPLFLEAGDGFSTTHAWTREALNLAWERTACEHFIVETYTWSVLLGSLFFPEGAGSDDALAALMAREIEWVKDALGPKSVASPR